MKNRKLMAIFLLILILPQYGFWFWQRRVEPPVNPEWVESQNQYALDSFKRFVELAPLQNRVFSPFQNLRLQALSGGDSASQNIFPQWIQQSEPLNELKKSLLKNQAHQVEILFEEVLLKNKSVQKNPALESAAKTLDVKIRKLSFDHSGALRKTQRKFQKQTRSHLDLSLEALPPQSPSQALSGFYLSGDWQDGFPEDATQPVSFETNQGAKQVLMMKKKAYLDCLNEESFDAFDLRYGDGKVSLMVFIPKAGNSLTSFYGSLSLASWKEWLGSFLERPAEVELPRFDYQDQSQPFAAARLSVQERGGDSRFRYDMREVLGPEELFRIPVRRPFFFAVVDHETGLILLLGQILDPSLTSASQ